MKKTATIFLMTLFLLSGAIQAQHNIIPVPRSYEATEGELLIEKGLEIILLTENESLKEQVALFGTQMKDSGIEFTVGQGEVGKTLKIALNETALDTLGTEGYQLVVEDTGMLLTANTTAGTFNGLQTIKQLLPVKREASKEGELLPISIKTCIIEDAPRFGWRGLMLDVSRHFFSVDEVKAYLDQMAEFKFNVFHWHLTDDQGWRIEIKTFPKLTEVGAWRVERHGRFGSERAAPKKSEKTTYGGFYTQEEVKDIIAYAAARNITIVPEIDVPGHSMALLAAYPQYSTRKEFKHVNPGSKFVDWYGNGKFKMLVENTLNPADPAVYAFLDMVFEEIANLFPGEYIHMGGDECYHGFWEEDAKVKDFMAKNSINNGDELQSYFVKRVEKIISSKGKKMIGWDEILEGGLAEGAAVMSWRGMKGGIEAAGMGHEVVMTPTTFAYLDYTQGDYSVENKIYADLSLEKSYSFDPVPELILDPYLILGGQGNLWTEDIPSLSFAFYMTYPRAMALSESLWSNKSNKNWDNFLERTSAHLDRFDEKNINVARTIYEPEVKVYKDGNKLMCELKNHFSDIEMYYTIDNTYPVSFGKKYEGPFQIPAGNLKLRVQSFRNGEPIERLLIIDRKDLESRVK
ncbi:beta-N-acetylhexosaminidase [Lutimonas zeaxanthinifaciens]|uniref:beta-N-acetylhexosaminidase n=1 Tax=Lutimonas zeaxanthinifaciens TaxID=3060215 RepID=UPI00265C994F|nr:family 20 glycosylhydrolase [Lutimonas sp. YSD2104]WKK65317.1 family 20 glycosylhydrolase [Lutimonas sp. YSD2104]